nr:unnamed protein product [Callosobruchus chinensis]
MCSVVCVVEEKMPRNYRKRLGPRNYKNYTQEHLSECLASIATTRSKFCDEHNYHENPDKWLCLNKGIQESCHHCLSRDALHFSKTMSRWKEENIGPSSTTTNVFNVREVGKGEIIVLVMAKKMPRNYRKRLGPRNYKNYTQEHLSECLASIATTRSKFCDEHNYHENPDKWLCLNKGIQESCHHCLSRDALHFSKTMSRWKEENIGPSSTTTNVFNVREVGKGEIIVLVMAKKMPRNYRKRLGPRNYKNYTQEHLSECLASIATTRSKFCDEHNYHENPDKWLCLNKGIQESCHHCLSRDALHFSKTMSRWKEENIGPSSTTTNVFNVREVGKGEIIVLVMAKKMPRNYRKRLGPRNYKNYTQEHLSECLASIATTRSKFCDEHNYHENPDKWLCLNKGIQESCHHCLSRDALHFSKTMSRWKEENIGPSSTTTNVFNVREVGKGEIIVLVMAIARGKDIADAFQFFSTLQNGSKVKLFMVTDEDIDNIAATIPNNIMPLKGIVQVHQM